jgi:hypothetical protein
MLGKGLDLSTWMYSHGASMCASFVEGLAVFALNYQIQPRVGTAVVVCDNSVDLLAFLGEVAQGQERTFPEFLQAHCPVVDGTVQGIAQGDAEKWNTTALVVYVNEDGAFFETDLNRPLDVAAFESGLKRFYAIAGNETTYPHTWRFFEGAKLLIFSCWLAFIRSHLSGIVDEALVVCTHSPTLQLSPLAAAPRHAPREAIAISMGP